MRTAKVGSVAPGFASFGRARSTGQVRSGLLLGQSAGPHGARLRVQLKLGFTRALSCHIASQPQQSVQNARPSQYRNGQDCYVDAALYFVRMGHWHVRYAKCIIRMPTERDTWHLGQHKLGNNNQATVGPACFQTSRSVVHAGLSC